MTIVYIFLAIALFSVNLFLNLKYGSAHPWWPVFIFVVPFIGLFIYGWTNRLDFPIIGIPLYMIAMLMPRVVAFPILRKRAGKLILTYKKSIGKLLFTVFAALFILFMSFGMSIPNEISYSTGKPILDERYYLEQLSISIIFGLLGLTYVPVIFRKGEIFENGHANPEMQYYPWNNYKTYEFIENPKKKKDERFSLVLAGGGNYDFTIHGFSGNAKYILDELLSTKLKKIPEIDKPKQAGQETSEPADFQAK